MPLVIFFINFTFKNGNKVTSIIVIIVIFMIIYLHSNYNCVLINYNTIVMRTFTTTTILCTYFCSLPSYDLCATFALANVPGECSTQRRPARGVLHLRVPLRRGLSAFSSPTSATQSTRREYALQQHFTQQSKSSWSVLSSSRSLFHL